MINNRTTQLKQNNKINSVLHN